MLRNSTAPGSAPDLRLRLLLFLGSVLIFQLFFLHQLPGSAPFEAYLTWTARLASAPLEWAGYHIERHTATLAVWSGADRSEPPLVRVSVEQGCDGLQAMFLFIAAVLWMPARWWWKVLGCAGGAGVLLFVNILRIDSLTLIQLYRPQDFELVHLILWPVAFLLTTFGLFWAWARRGLPPTTTGARGLAKA